VSGKNARYQQQRRGVIFRGMRTAIVFVAFLLLIPAVAQQHEPLPSPPNGSIYGIVTGQDGQPARGIGLTACPDGALGAALPHTISNDRGEYRFDKLPWWGRYSVNPIDEVAGYSVFSTSFNRDTSYVRITQEHPEAELNVRLSPSAGLLRINLTNRRTGTPIGVIKIAISSPERPSIPLFATDLWASRSILVPPNQNLLLHVTSNGFHEWSESAGRGKPIKLASGVSQTLDVQLDPSD